jgi:archaellum component FlaF (FlaF/FlaG flagellin family)
MSFEMTSLKYDSSRKVSAMQTFKAIKTNDRTEQVKVFMPVPYNIGFQLSIMTKLNDDMLQIVEQILPAFQPSFSLTINLISSIGEKKDVPVILEGIVMEDNYESDYKERRALVYTLNFTAKTYLFGPIPDSTDGIIKKVQVDYYTNTNTKNASRQLRYTATPRAIKDYNNDNATTLAQNIDDNSTVFNVSSAVTLVNGSYIMIDNEEMYIKNISENTLTVLRGQDGTSIESHNEGDSIDAITTTDNELVEMDDDFGFSESRFDFGDGKVYSTTKGIDVSL